MDHRKPSQQQRRFVLIATLWFHYQFCNGYILSTTTLAGNKKTLYKSRAGRRSLQVSYTDTSGLSFVKRLGRFQCFLSPAKYHDPISLGALCSLRDPQQRGGNEQHVMIRTDRTTTRRFSSQLLAQSTDLMQQQEKDEQQPDLESLKNELQLYLEKRKSLNADEAAKDNIGKVIGGTKGNLVLEYISGAPNKAKVIEAPNNPLDYEELAKYGYGHLVTPIMKAGGRIKMYELLGMDAPPIQSKPKPKIAPKLTIDRDGRTDTARYSGLKLGQALDDTVQAEALARVQKKIQEGEEIRPKLVEETYEIPFADKRNTSPAGWTPDWTVERLDEWGKQQGKAQTWARKAREGEFVSDPNEWYDLGTIGQQVYSISSIITITLAFGKASVPFLTNVLNLMSIDDADALLTTIQGPAIAFLIASIGSSIFCLISSSKMNRSQFTWAIKGFLGGPLTVQYLKSLPDLKTRREMNQ